MKSTTSGFYPYPYPTIGPAHSAQLRPGAAEQVALGHKEVRMEQGKRMAA